MIKISSSKPQNCHQIFTLFTEEYWLQEQHRFNSNIGHFFNGKKNDLFVETTDHGVHYLIGLGAASSQDFEWQQVAAKFAFSQRKNLQPTATAIAGVEMTDSQLENFVKGLYLGTYQYPFKNDHPFWNDDFQLSINYQHEERLQQLVSDVQALCHGQFVCMDWMNKPANYKSVPQLSEFLEKMSADHGLKYSVFNRQQCVEMGLGAFAAVNQGSAHDAAFTILEYQSGITDAKTIGLVGKCVLFDTGGVSLKNPENMHYMKSDMGGATAVFGTLMTAAEMKLPVNIIAVLPATDNAVSANAYLPSDVVKAYNGKTIEVLNTDAEGRMTLADGLAYLTKNYKTDVLIDLATLTGSAVRMFGDTCGALFSNSDHLRDQLIKAGESTNQRLWNLPLWHVWEDELKSDVADLRHMSLKPIGDCIVAAKFLQNFINEHPAWAHLDIAGVAFGNVIYSKEKAATGYGVQLLLNFIKKLI